MKDKYSAVWVSHSSISDFLKCPRAYYLKNVYKDKRNGHKIQLIRPSLALGQAVHSVIESLATIPTDRRFEQPLHEKFKKAWQKVEGIKGGFRDKQTEEKFKERGRKMIEMVNNNPGPLRRKSIMLDMDLPYYWISENDNIILCGKIDWLEYLPDTNSVNIIDFKTGKEDNEDPNSLQLPIYHLLVKNCQSRKVNKAYYWYIENGEEMKEKELPDIKESEEKVLQIARKMKLARQLESFKCPNGDEGCNECLQYEKILNGKAEFVYTDNNNRDIYIPIEEDRNREGTVI